MDNLPRPLLGRWSPVAVAVASLGLLVPHPGHARSDITVSPNSQFTLIQKDVNAERWAIAVNRASGYITGNVFPTDGTAPTFLACSRTSVAGGEWRLSCSSTHNCQAVPCSQDWTYIGNVTLAAEFFAAPGESGPVSTPTPAPHGPYDAMLGTWYFDPSGLDFRLTFGTYETLGGKYWLRGRDQYGNVALTALAADILEEPSPFQWSAGVGNSAIVASFLYNIDKQNRISGFYAITDPVTNQQIGGLHSFTGYQFDSPASVSSAENPEAEATLRALAGILAETVKH